MCALRYPGGKTKSIKILEKYISDDIIEVYSPFCGGNSFEMHLQNKYKIKVYANDKFEPLYNFWHCLKKDKTKLIEEIRKKHPITKELFKQYKIDLLNLENNEFTRAACYFAINRSSFSGCTLSGGFSQLSASGRFTESSIKRLENIDLTDITFNNLDFVDFIKTIPEKKFIFLDPPYYLEKNSKLYGNNGDLHKDFDHNTLYESIKNKTNWLLCYNDCEYIRKLYKDFEIIEVKWAYGMNATKKSSEILIRKK